MSIIVKYSTGSTYTVVANKVDIEKVQDLDGQYHIPNTSIVGMMRLGLGVQKITVSGDALDMSACLWHDVVAISFDSGTSYQTVYFAGVPYTSDCWSGIYPYALSLLASPLKERTAVRYPTSTAEWYWGNVTSASMSQAGNVNAYPIIHYLAPLFYAPLSNTLIDFTGQSVTFTRTASKVHGGVTYPINTPIFDSGLYLASDTSQDVATWTPPVSTLRTIAMQIKSRYPQYPSPWSIGGSGGNLLTANQSNAETNTTGMTIWLGTLSRTVTAGQFYAGTAGWKAVSTGSGDMLLFTTPKSPVDAGWSTVFSVYAKSAAAKNIKLRILWFDSGGTNIASVDSTPVTASATFTRISMVSRVPTGATQAEFYVILCASVAGEILYVDNLMYEYTPELILPALTVWTAVHNKLTIDFYNNLLIWSDDTTTVSLALPAAYLSGTVMDVVLLDDTSHAVTIAVHPAGGSWTSATGTLAALTWPQLTLGNLEGSIANLIQYGYVLTGAESQAIVYSSLSLLFNSLYIGNRYAGEVIKGSDKRLVNANGSDISALLGGVDIPIGSAAVTIAQSQGLSARWYVEVKRTDV